MMRKTSIAAALLTIVFFLLTGCSRVPVGGQISFADTDQSPPIKVVKSEQVQPLRIAISTVLSPTDTITYYRSIANYLGKTLQRPVILLQRQSYAEIAMLLINGGADVAFMSSGAYATYGTVEGTEALVAQQRLGVPYYQAYIIVPQDSKVTNVEELRGASMAFTDPLSYSGYWYTVSQLRDIGETPEHFFNRILYTYSHEKSLRAVSNRIVQAASIDSLIYEYARRKNPEITNQVRIIAASPKVGTGPVVIGNTLSPAQRTELQETLLTMHLQPDMQPVLQALLIDRFVPVEPERYQEIRDARQEQRRYP